MSVYITQKMDIVPKRTESMVAMSRFCDFRRWRDKNDIFSLLKFKATLEETRSLMRLYGYQCKL